MVDIEKAKQEFKNYVNEYDSTNKAIKLKIVHTYGVVSTSEHVAKSLGLNKEDMELAKLIGLLHDVGRFEQVKLTNSFSDGSHFDHANYGIKILFEDNMIRKFISDSSYDKIIYEAVKNHNKYEIASGLDERELLFAKIIRDADKLDIYRVLIEDDKAAIFSMNKDNLPIEYEGITDRIYNDFLENKQSLYSEIKTNIDKVINNISYIFDIYFASSFKYIKEKNYINDVIDIIDYKNEDTKVKMENIRKLANEFVNKKCVGK